MLSDFDEATLEYITAARLGVGVTQEGLVDRLQRSFWFASIRLPGALERLRAKGLIRTTMYQHFETKLPIVFYHATKP